jgi:YfiH family protein
MTKIFPGLHRTDTFNVSDSEKTSPCRYSFFNSLGGISDGHFASLNIGSNVGDGEEKVAANRLLVKKSLGHRYTLSANQVHGIDIYCLHDRLEEDFEAGVQSGCDALLTNRVGVGLMIQHADCQPVLLYDPVTETIGAVHCGWRGSVQNILSRVVKKMVGEFGVDPGDVQAVIGPSLGPCCGEFISHQHELPVDFQQYMISENHFDFWQISASQLVECGVRIENIQTEEVCTACSRDWFSYRRACRENNGITGRNCSVIALI